MGIVTIAGVFQALLLDMVVRSIKCLILQSGSGGYGMLMDTNNYVVVHKLLSLNIDNFDRSVIENSYLHEK
jgi:hypothetical protein